MKSRKKPRTFTISVELDRMVEHLIVLNRERSYSSTLCNIITDYINSLDHDVRKKLQLDVQAELFQNKTHNLKTVPPRLTLTVCPACSDTQNVVNYPGGKWRCNLCMEEGQL